MTSALVNLNGPTGANVLLADLEAVGIQVLGRADGCRTLVQDVLRLAPDLVICEDSLPGEELFSALQVVAETAPRPVIVFTSDGDADNIARAMEAGVHAYVINGYAPQRLRSLVHLACARFKREQALRAEMLDVTSRFEERKMVDRAKGILMRARQVSDDDAFQMLRTASMHSNQRLGQVSRHIIHSARFAEDVNRSGQLRMLSQRLVTLVLLQLAGVQPTQAKKRLEQSMLRIDGNLAALGKSLSPATFGDLLGQVLHTWTRLKLALQAEPRVADTVPINELAEQLLQEAERLTSSLESAGAAPPLRVLNLAGRQRMLCQRFAKHALLGALGDKALQPQHAAGMAEARAAFEEALRYLNAIPLSNQDIRNALDAAAICWAQVLAGVADGRLEGLQGLAEASEELLEIFERLSAHYERSMQMLVG